MFKKSLFTAVAIATMSMVSYGANLNEDVKFLESIEVLTSDTPCADQRASDIHVLRNIIKLDWEDTLRIADELFYLCLEETYL